MNQAENGLLGDREGKYCLATLSDKEKEAAF
jgi:hypothetical protein